MKKTVLVAMAIFWGTVLHAQVVINLQLPPLGLTIKPQLWNMSLVNTGAENIQVRIEVVITDAATSQRVLTGTSNLVWLPKGVKQVRLADAMPVTYNTGNAGYIIDASPTGFLPVGVFNICYSVIKVQTDAPEKISEECETVEVEPVSPPQLMLPADQEEITVTRPSFMWVPPAPVNAFGNLRYDWLLVEVRPTQSAADAIQQNIPLLTGRQIAFTNFQYPLSMPPLDTTKVYAWRITATSNTAPVANSEVWRFTVKPDSNNPPAATPDGYFIRLHRQEGGAHAVCYGMLRFEYVNENNNNTVQVKIFDISSDTRKPVALDEPEQSIRFGQNFMQLDLRQTRGMINKHIYLLELLDAKNEKWYLRFEYRSKK